ncbi:MAG TPA: hypothetical protein VNZ86_00930 [Bacteroidia bacterium]|jgi:hypothetical protein|nr:hypothetical protein [Bacteroidia bacterium]
MTREELIAHIHKGIILENKENKVGSFLEAEEVSFQLTKRESWYTIQIVQQLPEELVFPKKSKILVISSKGITIYKRMFGWDRILLTGIRTIFSGEESTAEFVVGLIDGQVLRTEKLYTGIFDSYDINEFGHLVELYRCKYELEMKGDERLKGKVN